MSTAAAADTARHLFERHAPQVYSLCLRRLGSREEAEDAAQTVFLNAFGALQRGSQPRFEKAWLRRIAENVCHDRRARTQVARDLHALEDVLASPEREPGALAEIEQALAGLSEGQRRAIVLREWQGLSYREIAAELRLSEAAAEALAFRARRSLAERLRASRTNLSLLGWLKPALGGSAAVAKLAAAVGAVAVAAGTATAGYVATRDDSSPSPPPAPVAEAPRAADSAPSRSQARGPATVSTPSRPAARGATDPASPGASAPASAPGAGVQPAPPATVPPVARREQPPPSATPPVDVPLATPDLPIAVPELPLDLPAPRVEAPRLPPLEAPSLPPVEAPSLPPVEAPSLPPVEPTADLPAPPAVEPPPLPSLPGLP